MLVKTCIPPDRERYARINIDSHLQRLSTPDDWCLGPEPSMLPGSSGNSSRAHLESLLQLRSSASRCYETAHLSEELHFLLG